MDQKVAMDEFSAAILHVLGSVAATDTAQAGQPVQADHANQNLGVSVPRVGKTLGRSASVVMRQLTLMGDVCGMGWVTVATEGDRFMVRLTPAGRQAHAQANANAPARKTDIRASQV